MKISKTTLISVMCGSSAVIIAIVYLKVREAAVSGGSEPVSVLSAATDIAEGTLMERGLVLSRKVPRAFVQPGAITALKDIQGKVSAAKIWRGEQILGTKLVASGSDSGLAPKVVRGYRAVSIELRKDQCAGGLIRPDDRVDVFATFDFGDGDRQDKYTYLLFQDVRVAAVDSEIHSFRDPTSAMVEKKTKDIFSAAAPVSAVSSGGKVVTLLLGVDEAPKFIFARQSGEITLALRSPSDRAIYMDAAPVKIETLTGKSGYVNKNFREYRGR